jgi:hypothetical protein
VTKAAPLTLINPRAATGVGGIPIQTPLVDAGCCAVPGNPNAVLELATAKLQKRDPEACELFASVVQNHDVREGWLGLAVAHHQRDEIDLAGKALTHALSHHAIPTFLQWRIRLPNHCEFPDGARWMVRAF